MSYYVRYVITEDQGVTLEELEQALQQNNPAYAIDGDILIFEDEEYGLIDITYRDNSICESDLNLLEGFAQERENKEKLLGTLSNAKCLVTLQPIWSADDEVVEKILDPLWDWLLANRAGILAIEGGHFYNQAGPLD